MKPAEEKCDWSGCFDRADGVLLRPANVMNDQPRPSWLALQLYLCEFHSAWMIRDCPGRIWKAFNRTRM